MTWPNVDKTSQYFAEMKPKNLQHT